MYYSLESFISFCDENQIAQESVFTTIKNGLVKLFTRLVIFLDRKVKKMKDGKVKKVLQGLLKRAKDGLSKSKTLNENNPELVEILKQEADDIKKEAENVETEESYELQQGKALIIHSRTFYEDFMMPYLFGPKLPKPIEKEIYDLVRSNKTRDEFKKPIHFSIKTNSGYYFIGVGGSLHQIYSEHNLPVDDHFCKDEFGRECLAVMGYLTTNPSTPFSAIDVALAYDKLQTIWDNKSIYGTLETQFYW